MRVYVVKPYLDGEVEIFFDGNTAMKRAIELEESWASGIWCTPIETSDEPEIILND